MKRLTEEDKKKILTSCRIIEEILKDDQEEEVDPTVEDHEA